MMYLFDIEENTLAFRTQKKDEKSSLFLNKKEHEKVLKGFFRLK